MAFRDFLAARAMSHEFDYIRELRNRIPPSPRVLVGPGDDCAVLARPDGLQLITTDLLQDGVDFILAECGPRAAGRKAMAVNLSDIAAMAGIPTVAVVGLCLPKTGSMALAEELFEGIKESADRFGVTIAGGDTNSWHGPLVISITLLGETTARGPVRRNGAKPGDALFVTGPLGGSLLGRHLNPVPRIREALILNEQFHVHAMIDISDGLAADLAHLCEESQCGAILKEAEIPIHADGRDRAKQTGRTPLEHALHDGEDFELLFAVSAAQGKELLDRQRELGLTVFPIGECETSGLWLQGDHARKPLTPSGWVHTW
ncbi:MAG: thiamine-phosphate kinase [Gemmataceae bacterium]